MARTIRLSPYVRSWQTLYRKEADKLKAVFRGNMVAIEHIGSTAIPGIKAKPIIDILLVVRDIEKVDAKNNAMQNLGYEALGEYGIIGRRYFRKRKGEVDTHHVHTFQEGNPEVQRHMLFRDYLRAHADEAQAYTRLKERLAEQFQHEIDAYTEGKGKFIKRIDQLAKKIEE